MSWLFPCSTIFSSLLPSSQSFFAPFQTFFQVRTQNPTAEREAKLIAWVRPEKKVVEASLEIGSENQLSPCSKRAKRSAKTERKKSEFYQFFVDWKSWRLCLLRNILKFIFWGKHRFLFLKSRPCAASRFQKSVTLGSNFLSAEKKIPDRK